MISIRSSHDGIGHEMIRTVKLVVYGLAKYLGLFMASRYVTRRGLRILCYHGIWLGEGHYGNFLFISKRKFEERMEMLATSAFNVISLDAVVGGSKRHDWPDLATVITIDDGWYSTYRHMLPILKRYDFPATIYVSTYYVRHQWPIFNVVVRFMVARATVRHIDLEEIGLSGAGQFDLHDAHQRETVCEKLIAHGQEMDGCQRKHWFCQEVGRMLGVDYNQLAERRVFHFMSFEELRSAADSGFDIQLHTHRHRFPVDDVDGIVREIEDNRHALEAVTRRPLQHLCYPSGQYHPRTWATLRLLDILSATTTQRGLNFAPTPALGLLRLLDGEELTRLEFEAELSGFADLARRAVRWLYRGSARFWR